MYCQKIKKYCPKNKTNYFDKTSILNENADLNQCVDCVYFFLRTVKTIPMFNFKNQINK